MVTGKFNGLFFYFFLFFTCNLFAARFTSAVIGIDGLTCSACSFSTEQSIRKLDFVENVNMELNENMATITFKKDKEISIDAIVRRVYAAGFSVRSVMAICHFEEPVIISNHVFKLDTATFYVLKGTATTLSSDVTINFINEKYIPKKELSKWKASLAAAREQLKSIPPPYYFVTLQ